MSGTAFRCERCTCIRNSAHCGSCNRATVPVCRDCRIQLEDEQHRCSVR